MNIKSDMKSFQNLLPAIVGAAGFRRRRGFFIENVT